MIQSPVPLIHETSPAMVFSTMKEALQQLNPPQSFRQYSFEKGKLLFEEGAPAEGLHFITSGRVKVWMNAGPEREQIVQVATVNDCPGYEYLLNDTPYSITCSALENTRTSFLPRQVFSELMETNQLIADLFFSMLCNDVIAREKRMAGMAYKPVRGRLADALISLAGKYDDYSGGISLTRNELASYIGSVRETTCRILSEFKKEQVIRTEGDNILINNRQKLLEICNLYK